MTLAEARGLANTRRARCCGTAAIQSRPATSARLQKQLEAARTISFDKAATLYLDAHRATWGNFKHRQQWERSLKAYASPILGKAWVRQIDTALVLQVIEPMWLNKTETANRVRRRAVDLDWARAKGYRQGDNPARWKGHLDQLLPVRNTVREIVHHAALSYSDVPAFMTALRTQKGVAARALEFVVLTVPRTGDLIGNRKNDRPPMRWSHVDFDNATSTIPKTKTDTEHEVPLSAAALDLLKEIRKQNLNSQTSSFPIDLGMHCTTVPCSRCSAPWASRTPD